MIGWLRCFWEGHWWWPDRELLGRWDWQTCVRCHLKYDRTAG